MVQTARALLAVVGCLLILLISGGLHNPKFTNSTVDVSWPNCSPKTNLSFPNGIIGATGGLDFHPNNCLAQETTWFSNYTLYMNTGYPGRSYGIKYASYPRHCSRSNYMCLGYNYGYNAAEYAINYAGSQGAHSNTWWIDVETENSWTLNPQINRSVLQGAIDAVNKVPFISQIGIYSTLDQWDSLTNSWLNKLPAWAGTGSTNKEIALYVCNTASFTGGPILLSQYTPNFDIDLSCQNN